jgi:hypothetical protein
MSEELDGEAVIIDLASGRYHATAGVGATIWRTLRAGADEDSVMAEVLRCHTEVPADASASVAAFIGTLRAAGLVTPGAPALAAPAPTNAEPLPTAWVDPTLESHDDLEDLLLLDPVHDVSESGWPHVAPPQ